MERDPEFKGEAVSNLGVYIRKQVRYFDALWKVNFVIAGILGTRWDTFNESGTLLIRIAIKTVFRLLLSGLDTGETTGCRTGFKVGYISVDPCI